MKSDILAPFLALGSWSGYVYMWDEVFVFPSIDDPGIVHGSLSIDACSGLATSFRLHNISTF